MKKKSVFIAMIVPVMVAPVLLANSANAAIGGTPIGGPPSGGGPISILPITKVDQANAQSKKLVATEASVYAKAYADSRKAGKTKPVSIKAADAATFRWFRKQGIMASAGWSNDGKTHAAVEFQVLLGNPYNPKTLKTVPYCVNIQLTKLEQPKPDFVVAIGVPLKNQTATTNGWCHTPWSILK